MGLTTVQRYCTACDDSWLSLFGAYYELLISRRSDMPRVNEGSQFYLSPTLLSTSGMNHTSL